MSALVTAERLALSGRLQETSLELVGGTLTCLIGPNGSGKTSLLHALAGVGRPTGTVRIGEVEPSTMGPAQRQRLLSYLPASRDIGWPLAAADLIALGLPAPDEAAVGQVMAALQLAEFGGRRVDRLSTGERSRVLIARALVADPRLLLLDEPVSNLDPLWQLRLMDLLRSLSRDKDRALLVAMHDLELARIYADRLIIMQDGRIAADGDPRTLLEGPHIPEVFGIERGEEGWRPRV